MASFLLLVRETVPGRGQEPGSGRAEHPGVWAQWAAGTRRPRGGRGEGVSPTWTHPLTDPNSFRISVKYI